MIDKNLIKIRKHVKSNKQNHWIYILLNNFWRFYVPKGRYWAISIQHLKELGISDDIVQFLATHKK